MISIKAIRANAAAVTYTRGNQVYKSGKVWQFQKVSEGNELRASAKVKGSNQKSYDVFVCYNAKREAFTDYQCQCEAYFTYSGMCKHCVAVALYLYYMEQNLLESGQSQMTYNKACQAEATHKALAGIIYASSMKEKARYLQPELTGQVELVPILEKKEREWVLEFKIGAAQKYVLKNMTQLVEAMQQHEWVEYGKKLAFYHERSVFTPKSQALLGLLEQYIFYEKNVLAQYNSRSGSGYYSYHYSYVDVLTKRKLFLSEQWLVRFAQVLAGSSCMVTGYNDFGPELLFREEDPVMGIKVEMGNDGGYRLKVPPAEMYVGAERMCVWMGNTIYICSREFSEQMGIMKGLFTGRKAEYPIHPDDARAFCASVLPVLNQCTSCQMPEAFKQYEPKPCQLQVYLDRQQGMIIAKVVCIYGETSYNLLNSITVSEMHRDFQKEYSLFQLMGSLFARADRERGQFLISEKEEEERVYQLINEGIGQLQQVSEVFISESLKRIRIMQNPKVSVGITIKAGLLEVSLETERLPLEEIESILAGYRRKKKFYRLPDGTFLQLEDNALAAVAELAEGLELNGRQLAEGHLALPGYRSFYLDQILRENSGDVQISRSQKFKALLRDMKNVEDSDFEVPTNLKAQLRPYQKFGYRWMMTLKKLGFGGILADDMGLGKTIQAIAYLLAQKEQSASPASDGKTEHLGMVVCPASLVYNWESEIQRFAPSLKVVTVTGTASQRKEKIQQGEGDIWLTSYDLLKRDIQAYESIRFQHMIIDEAQNIKNYTTQAAKSVKALDGIHRFALTGTPIENALGELWSIFDFLMPGILNSKKKFRENYEQPIVSEKDERVSVRLRKMIRPFILRRLKKDVVKELPDKIEKVIVSRMGEEQKTLYEANLQQLLDSLNKQSPEEFRTGKLQILAELTKLRQLCCDPSMVYENYKGESAKVEACLDLIRSGTAGGNQILLFSQFTTALEIIGKRLDQEGISYYTLTGSTSKEKRASLVKAFNQDQTPVFLISLKAGGTGLNLTAASMVIHFDPWWNMAAQNQATDRAHRIGQKQVVTVYKLLMKDTLEEKIQKLQEQKARLSDEIIAEGSIRDTLATKEELFEILKAGGGIEHAV